MFSCEYLSWLSLLEYILSAAGFGPTQHTVLYSGRCTGIQTRSMTRKRKQTVKVFDKRTKKVVEHKKRAHGINHNMERALPGHGKQIQGRLEENCIQMSFQSALKALQTQYEGSLKEEDEGARGMWEEVHAAGRNFHEIVLPACPNGVYDPVKGYSRHNIQMFVRFLSQEILQKHGYYFQLVSLKTMTHYMFFNMSSGQRKNRIFVVFGWYPSTMKSEKLQKIIQEYQSSELTVHKMYEPLPSSFWRPKSEFTYHAIAVMYDDEGNGTIDDPAHKCYHPLTPEHFFRSCACISGVYELSIVPLNVAKK